MYTRSALSLLSGLVLASLLSVLPASAAVLRVKADAPGPAHDGQTWQTAYTSLPAAAAAAVDGDEVWVAQGTYVLPVETSFGFETGARYVKVKGGVSLYGGFGGYETARGERVPKARTTTIDGTVHLSSIGQAPVTVDGFTITHGTGVPILLQQTGAYDSTGVTRGAGIYVTGGTVTLSNNTLAENGTAELHWSDDGLGRGSHTRSSGGGGGIYVESGTVLVEGNTITGNSGNPGGGICATAGDVTVSRNVITDNQGEGVVGAAKVSNNLIAGNSGSYGSAVAGATVTVVNNTIAGNDGITCLAVSAGSHIVNNVIVNVWQDIPNTPASLLQAKVADFRHNCVYLPDDPDVYGYYDFRGKNGNLDADPQFIAPSGGDYRLRPNSPGIDAGDDTLVPAGETDLAGNPRLRGPHVDIGAYESASFVPPSIWRVKADAPGPAHDGKTWDSAFLTVQAALDASGPGEEVWVASGTYAERITVSKTLGLYGGFAGTETAREERDLTANASILDGGAAGTVVTIGVDAAGTAVTGFTIRNGMSEGAGGIDCAAPRVTLSHNVITGNRSTDKDGAGGVRVFAYSVRILDNVISDNVLEDQTGLNCSGGGIRYIGTNAEIGRNRIINNRSTGLSASGGGLYFSGGKVIIYGNAVSGNRAEGDSSQSSVNMRSMASGGGMAVHADGPQIRHNVITGNTAFARATFCHLGCEPGGLATGGGLSIAGIDPDSTALLEVANNLFADNRTDGDSGSQGGGLSVGSYSALSIVGNTFAGNTLNAAKWTTSGAAIHSESVGSTFMANNIVAFNEGATGAAIYIKGAASLANNDVFGNSPASFTDRPADPTGTNGNISADPQFVDRVGGNYRLSAGSPAIDTGSMASSWSTDLDGKKRLIGPAVDMGAYEAPIYATLADAILALKATGGLQALDSATMTRLNTVTGTPEAVDARDAIRLTRRAAGLDQ